MKKYVIFFLFLIVTWLALWNLDNTAFWDDEAETAINARNLLKMGSLTGWDGRNLLAYRNGTILDNNFRPINPPLAYVVTALSFSIFGESTQAGRLPFVLLGLCSLFLFYCIVAYYFPQKYSFHLFAFLMFGGSVHFLLNIRTCRYYALCYFFCLLIFLFYKLYLKWRHPIFMYFIGFGIVLFFYSHYLLAFCFVITLACFHLVFHRREFLSQDWIHVSGTAIIAGLGIIPYTIAHTLWHRPDIVTSEPWLTRHITLLWWNIREISHIGVLPWSLALFMVIFFFITSKKKNTSPLLEVFFIGSVNLFFIALLSPQPPSLTTIADIRYLACSMPFFALVVGIFFGFVWNSSRYLAVSLLLLSLTSNVLGVAPGVYSFRWFLPAYLKEIVQPYPTAYSEVSGYLLQNTTKDDTVYAYPDHMNYPLMFYTGHHCRFACLLNKKTHLNDKEVKKFHAPLYIEENFPQWLISFGTHKEVMQLIQFFSRDHLEDEKYKYKLVDTLDVFFNDTQRPEIFWHSFGPRTDFDRKTSAVYIFKRLSSSPEKEQKAVVDNPSGKNAIEGLLKQFENDPKNYIVCNNIGSAFAEKKDFSNAVKYWEKALNINPEYATAHRNLFIYYSREKQNEQKAQFHKNKLLAIQPDINRK